MNPRRLIIYLALAALLLLLIPLAAENPGTAIVIVIALPLVCASLVALAGIPMLLFRTARAHSAIVEPGHCPCGYDLTGNTSGKCPECGTLLSPERPS